MLVRIVAVGQRTPAWVQAVVADYLARMPPEIRVELRAVRTEPRGTGSHRTGSRGAGRGLEPPKQAASAVTLAREAQRIRAGLPAHCRLVVLDERGEDLTTRDLAGRLAAWQRLAVPVAIVIGGPDGIDQGLREDAHEAIRLSSLTLPHALVRVLFAEQLYRAWSINAGHPYHRE